MIRPFRAALAALVAGSVMALVAPTANALPVQPSAPAAPMPIGGGPLRDDNQLSKVQKKDVSAVVNIFNHAWNKKKKTLDYRKANTYDKGRTTTRRQMARGVVAGGGKLTHISKAERAKVMKIKTKTLKKRSSSRMSASSSRAELRATQCKGRNDVVTKKRTPPLFDVRYYFDSCRTDALISSLTTIGIAGGLLTAMGAVSVGPVLIAVASVGAVWLTHYQKISDIGATWVRDKNHLLTMGAQ